MALAPGQKADLRHPGLHVCTRPCPGRKPRACLAVRAWPLSLPSCWLPAGCCPPCWTRGEGLAACCLLFLPHFLPKPHISKPSGTFGLHLNTGNLSSTPRRFSCEFSHPGGCFRWRPLFLIRILSGLGRGTEELLAPCRPWRHHCHPLKDSPATHRHDHQPPKITLFSGRRCASPRQLGLPLHPAACHH